MAESYSVEAILSAKDSGFTSAMRNAKNSVSTLGKITSGLKFGALMAAGGKMFTTLASGARGFVSELNASQATWKTFEGNMKYFGKSTKEIKKVKAELSEFATKSVYNGSDMASTYSQLMALGVKDTGNLVKAFGGLAAASENPRQAMKTLSQQGAQMAAKPTVAWQDYKLMLEQSQSGMAAVAKEMGMSAGEMTQKIQEGKVKTEDFFNAMKKAAGEGTEFEKMATTYKDMGSAIDGVKESLTTKLAPAWDVVSDYGIKAIGKFEGVLGKIDGDKIAKVLSVGLSKASSVASKVFSKIAPVAASAGKTLYNFGKAVFDVGRSIATNKTVVDGLKQGFNNIGTAVNKTSAFMSKHSATISKFSPVVLRMVAVLLAAKGAIALLGKASLTSSKRSSSSAKTIKAVFTGLGTVLKNFGAMAKGIGQGLGAAFKGMGPMFQGLGKGISAAVQGIARAFNLLKPQGLLMFAGSVAVVIAALAALGALREVIIPFFNGMVGVFNNFLNVLRGGADVILTLVNGALKGLAEALAIVAPALNPISQAFASLSPLITAVGTAIATILPALGPVITALGTAISTVVGAVGKAVSGIAKAITPIVQIVANAITKIVQALAPYIPEITKMIQATSQAVQAVAGAFNTLFSNLSSIFNSIANVIQTFANGAVAVITAFANGASQVMTTFGNMISQILTSAGNFFTTFATAVSTVMQSFATGISTVLTSVGTLFNTFVQGVSTVLQTFSTTVSTILTSVGTLFTTFGTTVSTIMNSVSGVITSVGGAIKGVLDGIAGIFNSMGNAALNAGKGVVYMAKGLKVLVKMSLADLAATLITVSKGLSKMASSGDGLSKAGSAIGKLGKFCKTAASGLNGLSTATTKASATLSRLASTVTSTAGKVSSAGKKISMAGKTSGSGFSSGMQNGMRRAQSSVTSAMNAMARTVTSAGNRIRTAARTAGTGFSTALSSGMKQAQSRVTSAMSTIQSKLSKGANKAKSQGLQMGNNFSSGLKTGMHQGKGIASSAVSTIASAIRSGTGTMRSVGRQLGNGVASGLRSALGSVRAAANRIVAEANRAAQAKAKIHSPSRLMAKEVGRPLAAGIAQGMVYGISEVKKAARRVINDVARVQTQAVGRQLKKTAAKTEGQYASTWSKLSENLKNTMNKAQESALKFGQGDLDARAKKFFATEALAKRIDRNNKVTQKRVDANNKLIKKQKNQLAKQKDLLAKAKEDNRAASAELKQAEKDRKAAGKAVTANAEKIVKNIESARKAEVKGLKSNLVGKAELKSLKKQIAKAKDIKKKTELTQRLNEATKNNAKIYSQIKSVKANSKAAEKQVWKDAKGQWKAINESYKAAKKVATAQKDSSSAQIKSLTKSTKKLSDSNKKLSEKNKEITKANTRQNKALTKTLNENKKKAAALYKAAYAQYEKYVKGETSKAVKAIDNQISTITSKYQALYDTIASQRSTFLSNLKDYGSLYEADQYGYVAFKDWNKSIKEMTTLQANLKRLQKAGVSQGFLSEITSMSTAEALTYTNALLKKGTKFAKSQSNSYDTMMKKASQISSNIYQPYVDAVDKAYNKDLTKALKNLDNKLEKIGQDAAAALARGLQSAAIKLGVTTQTGMAKGVKKSSKKSSKATSKAAGKSTTAAKKKLKVHSPSRVFAQIGEMTGAGFVRGIDSMGRRISTATMDMIRIPRAESPRLAYAGDAKLNDNYTYGGSKYEITVVSEIDGREFARATVDPMSEELERKNRNSSRNRGRRT